MPRFWLPPSGRPFWKPPTKAFIVDNPSTSYRIGKPTQCKNAHQHTKREIPRNTPSDTPQNTPKYENRILGVFSRYFRSIFSIPCRRVNLDVRLVFLSNTTYNNNYWCRPGSIEPSPSGRQRPPSCWQCSHRAYCQHEVVREDSTTQRREENMIPNDSHQMSSRHLSFNMVAEPRINNWASTSESVQDNQVNDIRISAGQLGNDISLQRPGGPQGGHRGGTAGNDISSASVSCFWLNIIFSSPPHQHAAASKR